MGFGVEDSFDDAEMSSNEEIICYTEVREFEKALETYDLAIAMEPNDMTRTEE